MTRTEELLALAEAATRGPHRLTIPQPLVDLADRNFQRACTPETIKQLVELAVLQNQVIEKYRGQVDQYGQTSCYEVIAAFNKFEQGEK